MQVAAQAERKATLSQYQAETTAFIEQVRAEAAARTAVHRTHADDEVVAIREWSKGEMARIREETDRRITVRKGDLEATLERQAARVDHEIERIKAGVETYEAEMAQFFERLQAIDDPTTFAAIAASLPEPPPFVVDLDRDDPEPTPEPVAPTPEPAAEAATGETVEDAAAFSVDADASETPQMIVAPEAVEAPESQEYAADATAADSPEAADRSTPVTTGSIPGWPGATDADTTETTAAGPDPRVSALGLTPDFEAAAAEAAVDAAGDGSDERDGIPSVTTDALAARLANLVPPGDESAHTGPVMTTAVVVVGLVSVASIASFKRHLARVTGVQSVGVASGPDGEFVFRVVHQADVAMPDAVVQLEGFEVTVTSVGDGVVHVTALDPEAAR
ncbi:MAG: hypothetical protein ACHQ3P_10715 [Candidatus Limnocylindrales bacterium]